MSELEDILGLHASAPGTLDPATDKIVRTVYGEAANQGPTGHQAVAAVIMNRAKAKGLSPDKVITPDQFEPWNDPKATARMLALKPTDATYQSILGNITPVLAGQSDPTGGATNFYSPKAQAAKGRQKPAWDDGSGQAIGDHLFFKPGASDDLLSILGGGSATPSPPSAPSASLQQWASQGQAAPKAPAAAPATKAKPSLLNGLINPPAPVRASDAFFSMGLSEVPRLLADPATWKGAQQGMRDFIAGLGPVAKGMENAWTGMGFKSDVVPAASPDRFIVANKAARHAYEAQMANAPAEQRIHAGTGRIGAQVAASAPIMALTDKGLGVVGNALTRAAPALEPAMTFLAGQSTANPLLRILSGGARGAFQGGEAGLLTSGASDRPVGQSVAQGALLGGVVGSAVPAGQEAFKGLKTALPFTAANREAAADKILRTFAEGGPTHINAGEIVPGSAPTLAEATGNPGIAGLERSLRNSPQAAPAFLARDAANRAARENAVNAVIGDKGALDDLIQIRSAMADPIREAAFASHNAYPTDPSPAIGKIDEILSSPAGQRDVVKSTLGNIRAKLIPDGGIQTDPAQLYGVRQAIGDMLDARASGEAANAKIATRELMQVRDSLDGVIENGAPGFKEYLKTFAGGSRPVNEQQYLQSLNLTDSKGNLTLGRIDGALKRIELARGKPGANDAKSISDATLGQLYAVRDDLRRADNLNLGRSVGSNTVQNLLTGNAAAHEGAGAALSVLGPAAHLHPVAGVGLTGLGMLRRAQAGKIQDILVSKLLDPSTAGSAFAPAASAYQLPSYAIPAGVVGYNRLVSGSDRATPPPR